MLTLSVMRITWEWFGGCLSKIDSGDTQAQIFFYWYCLILDDEVALTLKEYTTEYQRYSCQEGDFLREVYSPLPIIAAADLTNYCMLYGIASRIHAWAGSEIVYIPREWHFRLRAVLGRRANLYSLEQHKCIYCPWTLRQFK